MSPFLLFFLRSPKGCKAEGLIQAFTEDDWHDALGYRSALVLVLAGPKHFTQKGYRSTDLGTQVLKAYGLVH